MTPTPEDTLRESLTEEYLTKVEATYRHAYGPKALPDLYILISALRAERRRADAAIALMEEWAVALGPVGDVG